MILPNDAAESESAPRKSGVNRREIFRVLRIELERAASEGPLSYRKARSLLRRAKQAGVAEQLRSELFSAIENGEIGSYRLEIVDRALEYVRSEAALAERTRPRRKRNSQPPSAAPAP